MIATHPRQLKLTHGPLTVAALVRILLEPFVALGTLAAAASWYQVHTTGPYLILALLVFSLTFPGRAPRSPSPGGIARDVLTDWILMGGLLLMLGWATRTLDAFDERVLVAWITFAPPLVFVAHVLTPLVLPRILSAEGLRRRAVIAGAGDLGRQLAERLRGSPLLGVEVAGFFDDRSAERLEGLPREQFLGSIDHLPEYARKHRVELIYLALPLAAQPRIARLLDQLCDTTASVYVVPDIFLFDLIQARIDHVNGLPVLAVCETPFYGVNGIVKRISDLVLASIILVLIAPVLAALALAACIVFYDAYHKQNPLSPVVMAGNRVLVYALAALSVQPQLNRAVYWGAGALGCYLIGLTYAAKQENLRALRGVWPLVLLAAPFAYWPAVRSLSGAALYLALAASTVHSVRLLLVPAKRDIRRAVTQLIAGISLLDGMLAGSQGLHVLAALCVVGWLLTLRLQRIVAGT